MRSTLVLSSLAAVALLAPACVTTAIPTGSDAAWPHARVELDPSPRVDPDTAAPVQRVAVAPELPTVSRLGNRLRYEVGDVASADVRMCVAPAGDVTSVAVERGSTSRTFDDAVLADVRAWRFAPVPGPATAKTCQRATVVYRAP